MSTDQTPDLRSRRWKNLFVDVRPDIRPDIKCIVPPPAPKTIPMNYDMQKIPTTPLILTEGTLVAPMVYDWWED